MWCFLGFASHFLELRSLKYLKTKLCVCMCIRLRDKDRDFTSLCFIRADEKRKNMEMKVQKVIPCYPLLQDEICLFSCF